MCKTNIVCSYKSRKFPRTFYYDMIIKHFNLNICTSNTVRPMSNSIYNQFLSDKLRIFLICNKCSIWSKICFFFYLRVQICNCLIYHVKQCSFKDDILNYIHLCSKFCSLITYKTNPFLNILFYITCSQLGQCYQVDEYVYE